MFTLLKKMMHNTITTRSAYTVASYENALKALNSLQSNAAYLKSIKKPDLSQGSCKFKDNEKYLLRSGVQLEKLDTLSVIHVAGTKGKGSTCAFTESILRHQGFSTGFFSSPHLVTVRERIRINGKSISELQFAYYFWKIYKNLDNTKEHEFDMPTYFMFLTILMFNIFIDVDLDVAIIEVGIGGQYDCTNVIRNPVCIGITSLGLEHTSLLGDTIEDIAYAKSGIFKQSTVAFTVSQPIQAMRVLEKRALEKGCALNIIPLLQEYTWNNVSPCIDVMCKVQQENASLAIQLAIKWMNYKKDRQSSSIREFIIKHQGTIQTKTSIKQVEFPEIMSMDKIAVGLASCQWPGRTQILKGSIANFFLDGAHTIESIKNCVSWFESVSSKNSEKRYLIFNTTGDRDSVQFLTILKSLHFNKVYFAPNFAGVKLIDDEINCTNVEEQKNRCKQNSIIWGTDSVIADSVFEVLQDVKNNFVGKINCNNDDKVDILVTGSLHLVGATLTILDPNLTMKTTF